MRELPAGRDAVLLDFTDEQYPSTAAATAQAVVKSASAAGLVPGVIDVIAVAAMVLVQAEPGTGLDRLGIRRTLRGVDLTDDAAAISEGDVPVYISVAQQRRPPMSPRGTGDFVVLEPGALTTIQDLGRPGYGRLGIPLSGAADWSSLRLANRLVGNDERAAGLESTNGGLRLRARKQLVIAVTGALADAQIDGVDRGHHSAMILPADGELFVPRPAVGLRTYVAVRGGVEARPVLGSRSTDTLSGLGPRPLETGDECTVGDLSRAWPPVTEAPWDRPDPDRPVKLWAHPGPRAGMVENDDALCADLWMVEPASDRIGVRLAGGRDIRRRTAAADPFGEPVALGSVQIPPSGRPVIVLADHPRTGRDPVIAVLTAASMDAAAQLVPGQQVRFVAD